MRQAAVWRAASGAATALLQAAPGGAPCQPARSGQHSQGASSHRGGMVRAREEQRLLTGSDAFIVALQRAFGVPKLRGGAGEDSEGAGKGAGKGTQQRATPVSALLWLWYFRFFAALGDEWFDIVCLPLLCLLEVQLGRRVALLWAAHMVTGQLIKEIAQVPRPQHPRIAKLEHHFSTEFGFPSTHASTAQLPIFVVVAAMGGDTAYLNPCEHPVVASIVWLWFISVCVSRWYLGVHSVPDVLAGAALGGVWTTVFILYSEQIHAFLVDSVPVATAFWVGSMLLIAFHPRPTSFSVGPTVTALCIGPVSTLVFFTSVVNHIAATRGAHETMLAQIPHIYESVSLSQQLQTGFDDLFGTPGLHTIVRCVLGIALLLGLHEATNYVFGALLKSVLTPPPQIARSPRALPKATAEQIWKQHYSFVLPRKFVAYGTLGISVSILVPVVWRAVGLA